MYFTKASLWLTGILVVVLPTALAMAGPFIIRRRVGLARLRGNNEVAGFKFATVGVLYAVLMAFAVIVVWEKFSDAEGDVAKEAGAAATIYRLIGGIDGEPARALRADMTTYLDKAINDDWAAMESGKASMTVTRALDAVYAAALAYKPTDAHGGAVLSQILDQLNTITEARRDRLTKAAGIVPSVVWLVLWAGALVTIGFTLFFGLENLGAQTLMTGGLAILVFSGLLVILAIDHPFSGYVKVTPDALVDVLHDFGGKGAPAR